MRKSLAQIVVVALTFRAQAALIEVTIPDGPQVAAVILELADGLESELRTAALAPAAFASLANRARIRVVEELRGCVPSTRLDSPAGVLGALSAVVLAAQLTPNWQGIVTGIGMVAMVSRRDLKNEIDTISRLLSDLGDISTIRFNPAQHKLLSRIRGGDRDVEVLRASVGVSPEVSDDQGEPNL